MRKLWIIKQERNNYIVLTKGHLLMVLGQHVEWVLISLYRVSVRYGKPLNVWNSEWLFSRYGKVWNLFVSTKVWQSHGICSIYKNMTNRILQIRCNVINKLSCWPPEPGCHLAHSVVSRHRPQHDFPQVPIGTGESSNTPDLIKTTFFFKTIQKLLISRIFVDVTKTDNFTISDINLAE